MRILKILRNKWNELSDRDIKLFEILLIIISLIIAWFTINLTKTEIINNTKILEASLNQNELMTDQLKLNEIAINNQTKADNIKVIFDLNREFYTEKNINILTDIQNKTLANKYTEMEIKTFLDNFELLHYMMEKGLIDDNDVRVNFKGHLMKVCSNNYIYSLAEMTGGYGGYFKLCSDFSK